MPTTVIIVRHGESQHNADGDALSGLKDVPMTKKGEKQCARLAKLLEHCGVQRVFSSPLQRAIKTAKLVFPELVSCLDITELLTEFDYGDYDGMSLSKVGMNDPYLQQWEHSPGELVFPNGGSIREHSDRVLHGFEKLVKSAKEDRIAFVSHKTTIRLFIACILGLDLNNFRKIPCPNCSFSKIQYSAKGFELLALGITCNMLADR